MKLDKWQRDVLDTKGNICLRSGRQVGKSTVISQKAAEYAVKNSRKTVLIIASVERQALLLFEKVLSYLLQNYKSYIKKGKDKPTKHKVILKNGSTILCLPTGESGYGIRGYTIDLLIADEADYIKQEVWTAIKPMLAVTGGDTILLSTPNSAYYEIGYFYKCFNNPKFTPFHVPSSMCPRITKEFLEQERKELTSAQYTQEYEGEWAVGVLQFFPTELIRSCMTLQGGKSDSLPLPPPLGDNFSGIDVARFGDDEFVIFSVNQFNGKLKEIDKQITNKKSITENARFTLIADRKWNFRKINIDADGVGGGFFDTLYDHPQTRKKVVEINNSSKGIEVSRGWGKRKIPERMIRTLKEDLYNNLKMLMEQGRIQLVNNEETKLSLMSIQAGYKNDRFIISGRYSHIAEALVRAAWCIKQKGSNTWVR